MLPTLLVFSWRIFWLEESESVGNGLQKNTLWCDAVVTMQWRCWSSNLSFSPQIQFHKIARADDQKQRSIPAQNQTKFHHDHHYHHPHHKDQHLHHKDHQWLIMLVQTCQSRCLQILLNKKFKPTLPHILKIFIWKKFTISEALSGSLVLCPSSGGYHF